jgi:hypothetical protein
MADEIQQHPGFLGYGNYGGYILLHVDWPVYPSGIGWEQALYDLCQFPRGSVFFELENTGSYSLFSLGDYSEKMDPFDENLLHAAFFHKSLIELADKGLVSGVYAITNHEKELRDYESLKEELSQYPEGTTFGVLDSAGAFIPLDLTPPLEDPDEMYPSVAVLEDSGLTVTEKGHSVMHELLKEEKNNIRKDLLDYVEPLIEIGYYDTAIREASLQVEIKVKRAIGSNAYGDALIRQFFAPLLRSNKLVKSQLKIARTELRAIFKFIRNEYMHNFKVIDIDQSYVILLRISKALDRIEPIIKLNSNQ